MKKGFFAYSSNPNSSGQAIEAAITEINKLSNVNLESWRNLSINGNIIIDKILEKINASDFVCADLTGMNDNVLFEIGYSIAKKKPIYIIFDNSLIESERKFKDFDLLITIGYHNYRNSGQIVEGFHSFFSQLNNSILFGKLITSNISNHNQERKLLLYLKNQHNTDCSRIISSQLSDNKIPIIVDDAYETKVNQLSWYINQINNVDTVLAEFVPTSRSGFETQNSKCSFLSGVTMGLEKNIQMIVESPYETPLDFKNILAKYANTSQCLNIIQPFVSSLKERIAEFAYAKKVRLTSTKKKNKIQQINFGEYIAEHEKDKISDYYVETSNYEQLVKNEYNIIVGRKGTGKSAAMQHLYNQLTEDKRNLICVIEPINFEIDGLIKLIEELPKEFEKGFLIDAVWKFLIISEVAKSLYEKIKNKPLYAQTDKENLFLECIEHNKEVYLSDFSTRLEEQVERIKSEKYDIFEGSEKKQKDFKNKVSEILHLEIIFKLKEHFAGIFKENDKIIVLIDNLDKSWKKNDKINVLSKCLLGLLNVTERIIADISVVKSKKAKINFRLTVFLRSDIFKYVMREAREPDKIEFLRLSWHDPEIFFQIIENRFVSLNETEVNPEDLWSNYIIKNIDKISIKEYIINKVMPRPRDIIYFFKRCHEIAISRGHSTMETTDVETAYKDYSHWVFKSLIVENGITIKQMEDFLYGLLTCNRIITADKILAISKEASLPYLTNKENEDFIDHLVSLSILGREVKTGIFEFEYEFDTSKKNKILAKKLNTNQFQIHPALYPYLEIV